MASNKMSGFNDVTPKGYKMGQVQQFTPQQMQLMDQRMGDVGPNSYLSRLAGGDQSQFDEMEAPALRQFAGIQGNMASRFSGMGMGGRHSSGFQNTMNQAGSDFAQDLASKRADYRRQAINDLMGYSNQLLGQRPYERFMTEKAPKEEGFDWMGLGGAALGGTAGFFAGGPAGAVAGAGLGYNLMGRKGTGTGGGGAGGFGSFGVGGGNGGSQSGFFTGPSQGKNFVQF